MVVSSDIAASAMPGFQVVERDDKVLGVITVVSDGGEYDLAATELSVADTGDFSKE